MTNPELRRMETPLAERLADALNDAHAATEQFNNITWLTDKESRQFAYRSQVAEVCEAGISMGMAMQKLIAILCEEAPEPQED